MQTYIFNIITIVILSFFIYYIYNGFFYLVFKSQKNKVIFAKRKEKISHIKPIYFFTSIISIYLLYLVIEYAFKVKIAYVVIPFIFLYILISITKLIPFKIYILTDKGIFFFNPQFSFQNMVLLPYKNWKQLNIKEIYNKGDYFYIEIMDKRMGKITVSLYYTDYYQINHFKR